MRFPYNPGQLIAVTKVRQHPGLPAVKLVTMFRNEEMQKGIIAESWVLTGARMRSTVFVDTEICDFVICVEYMVSAIPICIFAC
jgi:hypothetical protein